MIFIILLLIYKLKNIEKKYTNIFYLNLTVIIKFKNSKKYKIN